jgi:esterase/lipase superfamily enzyme
VFVHGYNYGFEKHCKTAAELQRMLSGKAVVLMFSWPSNGRPTDYISDQADVEWSVPFLARILADLGDRLGPENVQVLAHSLGSRGVLFALERMRAERETRPLIGQLVLMAPDLDAQTFVERLPALAPLAAGITLYASSNDTPLKASRKLHASPRLGEAGEFLTVAESMQTVDVSPLGRYQVLGHEYFRFYPKVAADLAELLGEGRSAPERAGLRPVHLNGLVHWELVGDRPRSNAGDE